MPIFILVLFIVMAGLVVINGQERDTAVTKEKILQCDLEHLRVRSDEDVKFFELVRELLITPRTDITQEQDLANRLKSFTFAIPPDAGSCYNRKFQS